MTEDQRPDQEPDQVQASAPQKPPTKGRPSFAKLRRELSDEELSSSAVQRLLLDEIERLERETEELKGFRQQYHEAERNCAVLSERTKISKADEVLYGVCLCMGSVALGFAPSLWDKQPAGWISLAFGVVLIGGGVLTKLIKGK